ncbi:MAG: RsmB/NOP family class I SAM-dependent RNA methyltransferase, partial [Desulfurococcaceae archaeon]
MEKLLLSELSRVYGSLLSELLEKLRRPPRRLYLRVNTLKTTRERVISMLSEEGIETYPDEEVDDAIFLEVKGPFNIECNTDKKIIVDDKTAISLLMGANLYRPGIRKWVAFEKGDRVLVVTGDNTPVACVETTTSHYHAINSEKGLVGVNIQSPYRAPSIAETKAYLKGLIYPQSLPSIITSHVLNPKPGELIIDMNASPGGKTSHVVQLSIGRTRVIAIDRSEGKVKALKSTLDWLGLNLNVLALPMDSRYIHLDLNLQNKADKILIDPPCSNLGVRPIIAFNRTMRDIINLSNYQRQFLKAAYHVLKPGG